MTIESIHIWQAGFAILAAYAFAGLFKQFFGAEATVRPRLTVRQPVPVPQPVTVGVNREAYDAALAIVTQWHRERVMEDLAKVLSVGPVS